MLQTEFVKNLHHNYARIQLKEKPQEQRYQYCILNRGGIRGLLPCSLRYLNGQAYLYYDITSKQNVRQLFQKKSVTREWVKDFLWSFQQVRTELDRFLLDGKNILWHPEQIYQDLEDHIFAFLYVPYYEGEDGFGAFLDFMVERMDYSDEALVECVYKMYEQFEQNGDIYLQKHIFEDAKMLEREYFEADGSEEAHENPAGEEAAYEEGDPDKALPKEAFWDTLNAKASKEDSLPAKQSAPQRKGIFSFFDHKKSKTKMPKDSYQQNLEISMEYAMEGAAVAEEFHYGEEYGKTVYIEAPPEKEKSHRLYSADGRALARLDKDILTIGKQREEVDLALDDCSVSRLHARIVREGDSYYLEDMNSTNGTFKNGLHLQPYERRKLKEEDEIRLGTLYLVFR